MKKIIAAALCGMMSVTMLLGGTTVFARTNTSGSTIPDPVVECKTMDDAADVAGFTFNAPDTAVGNFTLKTISAIKGQLITIDYQNGSNGNKIEIRKGIKTGNVSGVYIKYKHRTIATVNSSKVVMKGNGSKISLAAWNKGKYSYSVYASAEKKGISKSLMKSIVKKILPEKKASYMVLKKDVQNNVSTGQKFNVVLEDNPSTGYEWSYKSSSEDVKLVKQYVSKDGSGTADHPITGAPSELTWTFTADKAGTYTITFTQARLWETGETPARTINYNIIVK